MLLQRNSAFALFFVVLYGLLLAYLMPFHELWSDETEPWLLALHSNSYSELLYNKRFEGHPNLWYSILYVVTRFTDNLQALKVSQYFFAVGFVFLFLRYAPFSKVTRLLFCFGYYGLFEYGILSRLYALELFTMFLLCAFYQRRFSHWYLYIGLLALNAQTHLFGLYFSGILGLLLFAEAYKGWDNITGWQKIGAGKFGLGFLLWLVGCGFSFWSITHYLGLGHSLMWDPYKIQQAATRIWQAFFPVPDMTFHFWNTSYLKTRQEIILSFILVLFFIYSLRPYRLLICLLLLFAALFHFFAFKYELYLRHHAHFFLYAVALFWLGSTYYKASSGPPSSRFFFSIPGGKARLFSFLLLLATVSQFLTGLYAVSMDYRYSFSPGKDVAAFLKANYPDYLLASSDEFNASTVGAYLKKPIYNLVRGRFRTFFGFDEESHNTLTPFQNLQWAQALAQKQQQPVILISSSYLPLEFTPYPVKHLKSFEREYILLFDKHIYLYQINPLPVAPTEFVAGNPATLR
ncbi:hypothetical protein GCM10027189_09120 [Rufibacter soli]